MKYMSAPMESASEVAVDTTSPEETSRVTARDLSPRR